MSKTTHKFFSDSPFKVGTIDTGSSNVLEDWKRIANLDAEIDGVPIKEYREQYNNFSNDEDLNNFFKEVLLKKVAENSKEEPCLKKSHKGKKKVAFNLNEEFSSIENDSQQFDFEKAIEIEEKRNLEKAYNFEEALKFLSLSMHQGGLIFPVSGSMANELDVKAGMQAINGKQIVRINTTSTGFSIQEIYEVKQANILDKAKKCAPELYNSVEEVENTRLMTSECELYLLQEERKIISDQKHLYLYREDENKYYYYLNINNKEEKFYLATSANSILINVDFYRNPKLDPVKCKNEVICDTVLELTRKAGHTLGTKQFLFKAGAVIDVDLSKNNVQEPKVTVGANYISYGDRILEDALSKRSLAQMILDFLKKLFKKEAKDSQPIVRELVINTNEQSYRKTY